MDNCKSRIQVLLKNPNPLFVTWLQEWVDEAEEKNSKSKYKLREALNSLLKFPLPLASGRDCIILKGFGPNICQLIEHKLNEYKTSNAEEYNRSINYDMDIKKLTKNLHKTNGSKVVLNRNKPKSQRNIKCKTNLTNDIITMEPGKFKIILLVDTQETTGKSKKLLDETQTYLNNQNVLYEIRRLSVGDFIWICKDDKQNELILPYIIERKRMDDFASSIRDGRYREQKFRLGKCGIDNIIYLIENYGKNEHVGLPLTTLMQAAVNIRIHNEFQVKFTDCHNDTMHYLTMMTKILIESFKDKFLMSVQKEELQPCDTGNSLVTLMKFKIFQDASSKRRQFTVREIFIKQLIQLKYLTVEKALAIVEKYPTPRQLIDAYKNCGNIKEAEELLASIKYGSLERTIGPSISKTMYNFYCCNFNE